MTPDITTPAPAAEPGAPTAPRVLVVINSAESGPRRLGPWLRESGLDTVEALGSEGLPGSLDGFDGLVMLGGGLMPDDDAKAPWLEAERALTERALTDAVPTLGICLGGQLLAHVGGGEVRENFGPKERGSTTIFTHEAGRADPLVAGFGDASPMIENHQDMITRLPEGAVLLASSEAVPNQAFRLGASAWGLQFHPEVCAEDLTRWDDAAMDSQGRDLPAMLALAREADEASTRASRALVDGFAAAVLAHAGAASRTAGSAATDGDAQAVAGRGA